jgi:predicted amidohydrolase YtcJ
MILPKTTPVLSFGAFLLLLAGGFVACTKTEPADLVLTNADVYTVDPSRPAARGIAIRGKAIVGVFARDQEADRYIGRTTRVLDLHGKFVTPGLIDGHVHFAAAGALLNDANLLAVSDEEGLRAETRRVVGLLDEGEWITEGMWGAYEQWAMGDSGGAAGSKPIRWRPDRRMIDDLTPNHPCLLNRFDGQEWLANTAALRAAGLEKTRLEGMEVGPDGQPTGIVFRPSPAFDKIRAARRPKSGRRLLDESRAALAALREAGITEVHDIATPDQTARFIELEERGELTCRIWLRPDLSRGTELHAAGFGMGLHPKTKARSSMLRYGALKGYIDGIMGTHGALFFEPYDDEPGNFGHWRAHTSDDRGFRTGDMEKMYGLVKAGLRAGFVPNVHAIGDRGVAEMLDLYERLKNEGIDLTGFRVIHAQVIRPRDFPRFRALGVIAEVNPYHLSDDMRWMEERIGTARCRGAYAFKSLLDNGAVLSFGSDWPGTSAAVYHVHPKYLIYAAVTRETLKGTPAGGWFPEQKITVEEALKAYTINNAAAAFEDDIRGSIRVGRLADLTVFDRSLIAIEPHDLLNVEVTYTIVDGRVVFERK